MEEEALNRLTTVELQSAFEKLSESQPDVLGLRIIGQLTLEETASVLESGLAPSRPPNEGACSPSANISTSAG